MVKIWWCGNTNHHTWFKVECAMKNENETLRLCEKSCSWILIWDSFLFWSFWFWWNWQNNHFQSAIVKFFYGKGNTIDVLNCIIIQGWNLCWIAIYFVNHHYIYFWHFFLIFFFHMLFFVILPFDFANWIHVGFISIILVSISFLSYPVWKLDLSIHMF